MYATSIYDHYAFDSVTLHPYMGKDSLEPFLAYQYILNNINEWNKLQNCGIVFGATNINELKNNINNFGDLSVLLPGIGKQGGSFQEVATSFNQIKRRNYIVNVSRGIIYKSDKGNFAEAAQSEIIKLNNIVSEINN
jgi:orotidine-5'-phosphate decarboxylase